VARAPNSLGILCSVGQSLHSEWRGHNFQEPVLRGSIQDWLAVAHGSSNPACRSAEPQDFSALPCSVAQRAPAWRWHVAAEEQAQCAGCWVVKAAGAASLAPAQAPALAPAPAPAPALPEGSPPYDFDDDEVEDSSSWRRKRRRKKTLSKNIRTRKRRR
jgi:hypothetical protein